MAVESETEPKGERRVDTKVSAEEKTWGETRRGSRGAGSETEGSSGEKTWGERDKRQPACSPPDRPMPARK